MGIFIRPVTISYHGKCMCLCMKNKRSDKRRVYSIHKETEFFDPGQIAHGIWSLGLLISPAVNQNILSLHNRELIPPLKAQLL